MKSVKRAKDTEKAQEERNESKDIGWGGRVVCFCHLILIQDFSMCISRLAGTHDPPTSGLSMAQITDKHNQR